MQIFVRQFIITRSCVIRSYTILQWRRAISLIFHHMLTITPILMRVYECNTAYHTFLSNYIVRFTSFRLVGNSTMYKSRHKYSRMYSQSLRHRCTSTSFEDIRSDIAVALNIKLHYVHMLFHLLLVLICALHKPVMDMDTSQTLFLCIVRCASFRKKCTSKQRFRF